MKIFFASLLSLGLTIVALALPPVEGTKAQPMVLLLTNFQIVEGLVERKGPDYVIKSGAESKTFAADKVLFAGESRDAVRQYLMGRSNDPIKSVPTVGNFNSQATRTFPVKMQPLLMNLCVNCHGRPDHPSSFKLARIPEGYADPAASRRNLEQTMKFVTSDDPAQSPLLLKALQAHGGQKEATFKNRQILAAQNLEKWLHWASLPEGAAYPETIPAPSAIRAASSLSKVSSTPVPAALPHSHDPFDPALFNQATQSPAKP